VSPWIGWVGEEDADRARALHAAVALALVAAGIPEPGPDLTGARDQARLGQLGPVVTEAWSNVAGERQGGNND